MTNEPKPKPTGAIWRLKDIVCKSLETTKERKKDELPKPHLLWNSKWFGPAKSKKLRGQCHKCATRQANGFCPTVGRHVRRRQTQCGQLQPKGAK